MTFADINGLLRQTIGLDTDSLGATAIEHAVKDRMAACAARSLAVYGTLLRQSETELQELIEAVIVQETWFYRHREAYDALIQFVEEKWTPSHPAERLRLLSLPCSSGEEPYSMAMALFDAGLDADRFRIDAVDISAVALARALQGTYGHNSFRGGDLAFRDRHFRSTRSGYQLSEQVHRQVRFNQGNLFADKLPIAQERYDAIFCRNLLVYFDRPIQNRAIRILHQMLAETGLLFVGSSESGLLLDHGFVSARIPSAFAFRKRPTIPAASVRPKAQHRKQATSLAANAADCTDIETAQRLADEGRLEEAARSCERHLQKCAPSAAVYHLLGMIRCASGKLHEADQLFRKALYLDPEHEQTLLHLALLQDRRGSGKSADLLRNRLGRVQQKDGK